MAVEVGEVLEGRYKLLARVSQGGLGAVYKARDGEEKGRLVAVKRIPLDGAEAERNFDREVDRLRQIERPGIPRLVDSFRGDGVGILVTDFIEGQNLEELLKEYQLLTGGAFPVLQAVEIALHICRLLEYLHAQQPEPLLHRNLKPANIIRCSKDGRYYLVDFGSARGSARTPLGTADYAPLEQLQGQPEPRSDQYSLAITLHHLLSGQAPFPLKNPPLLESVPSIDPRLAEVIDRAASRKAADRFESIQELRRELARIPPDLGARREPSASTPEPTGLVTLGQRSRSFHELTWQKRAGPSVSRKHDSSYLAEMPDQPPIWTLLHVQIFFLICLAGLGYAVFGHLDWTRRAGLAYRFFESPREARPEWKCVAAQGISRSGAGLALESSRVQSRSGALFVSDGQPPRNLRFRLKPLEGHPTVLAFLGRYGVLFEEEGSGKSYRARPVRVSVPGLHTTNPLNFVSYRTLSSGRPLPEDSASQTFDLRLEPTRLTLYLAPDTAPPRLFLEVPLKDPTPAAPVMGLMVPFPAPQPASVEISRITARP